MPLAGYKIRDQAAQHFITCTVVQWVDVFTRPVFAEIMIDSLNYCIKEKGLLVYAWILKPNHLHAIVASNDGTELSATIRDFKKFSAGKILKELEQTSVESRKNWLLWLFNSAGTANVKNDKYQFWQHANHPVELSNATMLKQRMDYLHHNLMRAGLVGSPENTNIHRLVFT